jgi:MFS family permease
MNPTNLDQSLVHTRLSTPRAAAMAGIVFSVLYITSLALIYRTIPTDPQDAGNWLQRERRTVDLALYLLPFAGIAFLWFIGVLRDRLGALEDRFFATVFLGSGLLFLAMLFAAGALTAGVMVSYRVDPERLMGSGIYTFARAAVYQIVNVYGLKMAGVFMISTSMIALRTGIFPRWMAFIGFVLATLLLLSVGHLHWIPLAFPLWVLLVSVYILLANLKPALTGPFER